MGVMVWVQIGFPLVIFMAGLQRVDPHLYEAAELDGAGWRRPALTGVAVHNAPILEPVIDAFEGLGLRVPGDLSVTAICPDELAERVRVPVTSIAIPAAEVGAGAVDLLMKKLGGGCAPEATLCCHCG